MPFGRMVQRARREKGMGVKAFIEKLRMYFSLKDFAVSDVTKLEVHGILPFRKGNSEELNWDTIVRISALLDIDGDASWLAVKENDARVKAWKEKEYQEMLSSEGVCKKWQMNQ